LIINYLPALTILFEDILKLFFCFAVINSTKAKLFKESHKQLVLVAAPVSTGAYFFYKVLKACITVAKSSVFCPPAVAKFLFPPPPPCINGVTFCLIN
jgi:hypothetical protein